MEYGMCRHEPHNPTSSAIRKPQRFGLGQAKNMLEHHHNHKPPFLSHLAPYVIFARASPLLSLPKHVQLKVYAVCCLLEGRGGWRVGMSCVTGLYYGMNTKIWEPCA